VLLIFVYVQRANVWAFKSELKKKLHHMETFCYPYISIKGKTSKLTVQIVGT